MIQNLVKKNFFIQLYLCLQQVKNRTKKKWIYILKSKLKLKDGKFKFHFRLNKIEFVEYSNQTINMYTSIKTTITPKKNTSGQTLNIKKPFLPFSD
jgi:hypothetical protein